MAECGKHNTELTLSPPTNFPDRYRGCAPGDQKKVRRHIVELDAHRDALRQAHPAEGRIDESQQLAAGGAVLVLDAVCDSYVASDLSDRRAPRSNRVAVLNPNSSKITRPIRPTRKCLPARSRSPRLLLLNQINSSALDTKAGR